MGCSTNECGTVGGITDSAHRIRFSALDTNPLHARNNVVHELGHAFDDRLSTIPDNELGKMQELNSTFPNRADFPSDVDETWVGPNVGFASGQNQFTWQMSYANAGSPIEEFADQFLGWVFNTWESDASGNLAPYGQARSDWMNNNMPDWIY
jgi:hypothetical protein